jgi:hypothetical protein
VRACNAAIPVLETNTETADIANTTGTADADDTHLPSEEQNISKGKYQEQLSNMFNIWKIETGRIPVNPAASDLRTHAAHQMGRTVVLDEPDHI